MRREFIFILLGIISVSTLSSLMAGYTPVDPEKVLLDTVVGAVGAGNFSYWQLGHTGPLLVELTSITGDADLYVADNISPSYEVDKNNYSSVTCGLDYVHIPASFPRPIGIGVFGYWGHLLSEYSIQVFLDGGVGLPPHAAAHHPGHDKIDSPKHSEDKLPKKGDKRKSGFIKLINIVDTIMDMFVL